VLFRSSRGKKTVTLEDVLAAKKKLI